MSALPQIPGYSGLQLIGSGGSASVYRARQERLERDVAIKVLREMAHDGRTRRLFDIERRILGQLSAHPHIVTVYDSGFSEDGDPYLVMQLCPRGSISALVEQLGGLSPRHVARVGLQVAMALEFAHRQQTVHRDVKPENVLISELGESLLSDFGIAAMLDADGTMTDAGLSPHYVAPELLRGAPTSPANDLYSLGSTLYTLLVGIPAHQHAAGEKLSIGQVLARVSDLRYTIDVPNEVDCPRLLRSLLRQLTAKDPAYRMATAIEAVEALRRIETEIGTVGCDLALPWPPTGQMAVLRSEPSVDITDSRMASSAPQLDDLTINEATYHRSHFADAHGADGAAAFAEEIDPNSQTFAVVGASPCPHCGTARNHGSNCMICGASDYQGGETLALNQTLIGRFRIEGVLGRGGFGIAYKARDLTIDRLVAIKEFFPMGCGRRSDGAVTTSAGFNFEALRGSFLREGRALGQFRENGIVQVHDVIEANSTAYIVMEYLHGETLEQRCQGHGHLSDAEVRSLAVDMLSALDKVHTAGLLHRDISPNNVILDARRGPVLIDFGAVRFLESERTATLILKHGYAPPEQYQTHGKLGPWTDLYALSATLYRILTGLSPVSAIDRLAGVKLAAIDKTGDDYALRRAIELGFALDENQRPQTAANYLANLGAPFRSEHRHAEPSRKAAQERAERPKRVEQRAERRIETIERPVPSPVQIASAVRVRPVPTSGARPAAKPWREEWDGAILPIGSSAAHHGEAAEPAPPGHHSDATTTLHHQAPAVRVPSRDPDPALVRRWTSSKPVLGLAAALLVLVVLVVVRRVGTSDPTPLPRTTAVAAQPSVTEKVPFPRNIRFRHINPTTVEVSWDAAPSSSAEFQVDVFRGQNRVGSKRVNMSPAVIKNLELERWQPCFDVRAELRSTGQIARADRECFDRQAATPTTPGNSAPSAGGGAAKLAYLRGSKP